MSSDLYADLQISKGASPEEVKPAYRKLARQLHPDKNADEQVGTTMLCPPSVGGVYHPRASCVWADLTHAGAHGGAFQEGQSRVLDPFRPRAAHRLRSSRASVPRIESSARDRQNCNLLLFESARQGLAPVIVKAVRLGARVQWRNPGSDGRTALHVAARG